MAHQLKFSFDVVLAFLSPLIIIWVAYRLSAPWTWADLRGFLSLRYSKPFYGPFSLQKAYQSYAKYSRLSANEFSHKRTAYNSLSRTHKRLGHKLGYPEKLNKLQYVTDLNAVITEGIAEVARKDLQVDDIHTGPGDLGRVREALKHFIRDWSEEGARERDRIFEPILTVLSQINPEERAQKKVLVPGSGLGRLAWEISQLGFDTTANELSFFMSLAFRFLLSDEATTSKNQHHLRPYAHWFSHQRSNESLFRTVSFPDAIPRLTPNLQLAEVDFLTLSPPTRTLRNPESFWSSSGPQDLPGYDYIVTLFFIDTSLNIFATIEHIFTLLRPGGTWINLGPLLWTSGGQAKLELSLAEVINAATEIGFIFREDDICAQRAVECEYTGDLSAMMRWVYKAEFWVAAKPK
ncbi:N2227-like protein-domain-containing protein [Collybia nuda]|uniref:N2227-like protein-domain-containing protein n=1 Tax=Collybia nuda TaxID=64659 RepID=A0A9P5XYH6_9AGAR|nr:N2227-like protein-domain-containing protein [Collybia nuda]